MEINIDGNVTFYKDQGQGEPILFIHGNPDSANYWDGVVSHLKTDYRCIAPDLPGFGRSELESDFDFSLEYGESWISAFLDGINLDEPLHLVVHDIGGFLGLPWAVRNPGMIKSICVHNAIFFSDYKWHFWGRVWRTRTLGELTNYINSYWLFKTNLRGTSPKLTDAYLRETYDLGMANKKTITAVLNIYRAMSPEVFKGWEDEYLELTTQKPTTVIWGDNDPYIPPRFRFAQRFANGKKLFKIPNGGHWAAAEYPEMFADFWRKGLASQINSEN